MTSMPITGHHVWGRAYGHDIVRKTLNCLIIIKCCFSFWWCQRCLCLHDGMLTWKDDSMVWKYYHCHPLCIDRNHEQTYFSFVQKVVSISIVLFVLCFVVTFHIYFLCCAFYVCMFGFWIYLLLVAF